MGWYCRFIGDVTSPTSRSKTVVTDRKYNTKRVTTMCVHVHGFQVTVCQTGLCACEWVHSLSGGLCGRYSTFFLGGGGLGFLEG